MPLSRITLRLARNEGLPNGDPRKGYILLAPLDSDGRIDLENWRKHRKESVVLRFDPDPDERADGWLTHKGSHWYFHYDEQDEGDDEAGYRLGEHVFANGEYVTIRSHGEEPLTYVVTEVTPHSGSLL